MSKPGFTVLEIIAVATFLIVAGVVLMFQVEKINTESINSQKKVAVNAIYYSLEESFYKENKFYPEQINKDTLKTMDPQLLVDPSGIMIGEPGSAYRYEPRDCRDGKCNSYSLRAILTDESDFVHESRNK